MTETVKPRKPRFTNRLEKIGWSREHYDLCWMACPNMGHHRVSGNHEICLCTVHIVELEATAQERGYSHADPPKEGGEIRLVDADRVRADDGSIVFKNEVYERWWPWQLLVREEVAVDGQM